MLLGHTVLDLRTIKININTPIDSCSVITYVRQNKIATNLSLVNFININLSYIRIICVFVSRFVYSASVTYEEIFETRDDKGSVARMDGR